jgi:hypothetical protein
MKLVIFTRLTSRYLRPNEKHLYSLACLIFLLAIHNFVVLWDFLVGKFKRFDAWVGNAGSMGVRHTLLVCCHTDFLVSYVHVAYERNLCGKLDKHIRRLFWQGCNKKEGTTW